MKRKTWISFLVGLLICLISVLFVGCDEETNSNNGITFNTLTVEETTVYGTVANSVESFSFIDEINVNGKTKFVVSLDIYGLEQIPTKTLPLEIGNNTVYITEMLDDEPINVFTVTLRRRPMYTVNFNTSGGTRVESQMVEEGFRASKPDETITRIGYTFTDWNYDFTTPITGDITITAGWMGNNDTPYKVEYYFQNLENDGYTLQEEQTEYCTGTTDTIAIADIKEFAHFTPERESVTSIINGDGKSVLKVYYTRNKYTVTFDGNGGTLVGGFGGGRISRTVKYGGTALAPTFVLTGYTLNGWDKSFTNVSENVTIKAQWKINQYTLTIVYDNGQDNKLITQNYNTDIDPILTPYKESWEFIGWDTQIPTVMPAENRTITAKWKSVCIRDGNTITGLSDYGKQNCTELEIPSSIDGVKITSISSSAFENCSSLISVTIPDSVTRIGWSAFRGCNNLTEMTLPFVGRSINETANADGSVGHIGYLFGTGGNLGDEDIPVSLKKVVITKATIICRMAFSGCSSLTSIIIPDSVTSIGIQAFWYCRSLTSVVIGNSVTSIGVEAFYNCSSLMSIDIPDSVTSIGSEAFENCSSLEYNEKDNLKYLGNEQNPYLYLAGVNDTSITSATIESTCKWIGNSAFSYCDSLTNIEIPNGVTSIGEQAFYSCDGLTSVTIGDSVTSIGDWAFYDCDSLTSIEIPDSVTSIGNYAFYNCYSLASVVIGDNVTSIGSYAFSGCSSLTSVVIGDNVTSIGCYTFYKCSSLMSIMFKDTSTWYRTTSSSNWENKTGGTSTSATNSSTNATYFKSISYHCYWYKL